MDKDDVVKEVMVNLGDRRFTEIVKREAAKVGKSDLTLEIELFLASTPHTECAETLRRIAALNQGTFEDLARTIFMSYILAKTGIMELDYRKARQALRTHRPSGISSPSSFAARGAETDVVASDAEFLRMIERRK